jgi:hypothetical protein
MVSGGLVRFYPMGDEIVRKTEPQGVVMLTSQVNEKSEPLGDLIHSVGMRRWRVGPGPGPTGYQQRKTEPLSRWAKLHLALQNS